ncbi:VOC family protein [Polluticoccus soli]|uniref:VOC family protein n=1 Tax=Polluticoccus soli TaxID=3034150 RepID=UPI0023E2726B|nr:VOC family protein [Flavipsychrobacter sp. JY13-12]
MNLNQVTVPVLDVEASIRFYTLLGLHLIVHSQRHYARFECPDGDATFSVHRVDSLPPAENGIWIYFETERLDALVAKLITNGIAIDEMPNDKPWLWREARLKDPNGNQLILYYAGDNRKDPPWRIKNSVR